MQESKVSILSIITINYNGFDDTCELVESLNTHLDLCYELIVVDNNSRNEEGVRIQQRYPHVKVIQSPRNVGFSGGNNLGINASSGKYIMLLNNDTLVTDNSIYRLIDFLESNPRVGGVTPKIKFYREPQNIQFAGATELSKITLRNKSIANDQPDSPKFNISSRTAYLHGAAMMMPRSIIEEVGLMPEMYFLYYEEIDYSSTIKSAGYELWYVANCTVFHKESRSTGVNNPLKIYYLTRNRLLFTYQHRKGILLALSLLYQIGVALPIHCLSFLLKRKPQFAKAALKGVRDYFKLL